MITIKILHGVSGSKVMNETFTGVAADQTTCAPPVTEAVGGTSLAGLFSAHSVADWDPGLKSRFRRKSEI